MLSDNPIQALKIKHPFQPDFIAPDINMSEPPYQLHATAPSANPPQPTESTNPHILDLLHNMQHELVQVREENKEMKACEELLMQQFNVQQHQLHLSHKQNKQLLQQIHLSTSSPVIDISNVSAPVELSTSVFPSTGSLTLSPAIPTTPKYACLVNPYEMSTQADATDTTIACKPTTPLALVTTAPSPPSPPSQVSAPSSSTTTEKVSAPPVKETNLVE